jgi:hypothetical protein
MTWTKKDVPNGAGRKRNSLAEDDEMALLSANAPEEESICTNASCRHSCCISGKTSAKEKKVVVKKRSGAGKKTRSKRTRPWCGQRPKLGSARCPTNPLRPNRTTTKTVVGLDHRRRVFSRSSLSLLMFPCVVPFIVVGFFEFTVGLLRSLVWAPPLFLHSTLDGRECVM